MPGSSISLLAAVDRNGTSIDAGAFFCIMLQKLLDFGTSICDDVITFDWPITSLLGEEVTGEEEGVTVGLGADLDIVIPEGDAVETGVALGGSSSLLQKRSKTLFCLTDCERLSLSGTFLLSLANMANCSLRFSVKLDPTGGTFEFPCRNVRANVEVSTMSLEPGGTPSILSLTSDSTKTSVVNCVSEERCSSEALGWGEVESSEAFFGILYFPKTEVFRE